MRRFSISLEDRILQMATDDGESRTKTTNQQKQTEAKTDAQKAEEKLNKEVEKGVELNDQLYERLVASIAKSKELFDIKQSIFNLTDEKVELLKAELILQDSYLNDLGLNVEHQEKLVKLLEKEGLQSKQKLAIEEEIKKLVSIREEQLVRMKELGGDYNLDLKTQTKEMEKALELARDAQASTEDRLIALKKIKEFSEADKATTQKAVKLQDKIDGMTGKISKNLGISAKFTDTKLGNFTSMVGEAKKLGGGDGLGLVESMLGKSILQMFSFKNMVAMVAEKTFEIAMNIEKASKELGKATGFGNAFSNTLRDTANNLTLMGGDEGTAKEAISSLVNEFSAFNPEAQVTNEYLATTVGRLGMIGVSGATSAKMIDHFNKVMGMTAKQSADTTAQISMMGKAIGVTASKMATDFQSASGRLTIYGDDNIKVFKDLAAQAKATGLEVNKLIEVSKGYDKFDSAAEKVGQLNAVLGTNLNTLEMINATDAERVEIIRSQVVASVGNFEGLDKFTKMHVANAMGLSDVAEAQRLLNMSQSEYLKNQSKQKESADIQGELAKMTAELVPTMQKLGIVAMKIFRVFTPLINAFLAIGAGLDWVFSSFAAVTSGMKEATPIIKALSFIIKMGILVGLTAMATTIGPVVGGILALIGVLGGLWEIFHKPGSLSMAGGLMDKTIGKSAKNMGTDLVDAKSKVGELSSEMDSLYDSTHPGGKAIDIKGSTSMNTDGMVSGLTKVKSILSEIANGFYFTGFLAMTTDGSKSSLLLGGSDTMVKSLSEGKLTVDVNMPKISLPEINVKVNVNTEGLKQYFEAIVEDRGLAR